MQRGLVAAAVLAAGFVALALAAASGGVPGEAPALAAAGELPGGVASAVTWLSSLRVWTGLVAAMALLLAWRMGWRATLTLLLADATAEVASYLAKEIVDRPRPALPNVVAPVAAMDDTASFPSSSVVRVTMTLGVLVLLAAWRRPAWRTLATAIVALVVLLVGVARVASGDHWPLDVVGGYVLAGLWLAVVGMVTRRQGQARGKG